MQSNKYFGSYYPIESSIHKLNPIMKFICLFLFLVPMIGSMSLKLHVVIMFFITMLMYTSNVPLKFYFNMIYGLRYIYIIILFFLASKGLTQEEALVTLLKVTSIIEYLALIFYTTSPSELKYGIEKTLNPFNVFNINLSKLSNKIITGIRFFPLLITTEYGVLKNASERGLDYFHSDILARINVLASSFKNTLRLTIEKIKKENFASELKMYQISKFRTNLRTNKIGYIDLLITIIHIIFVASYVIEVGIIWDIYVHVVMTDYNIMDQPNNHKKEQYVEV